MRLLVFTVVAIGLVIAGFWIYDSITRIKLKDKAGQIVETIKNMDSRFDTIEALIAEHGAPKDYLSVRVVSEEVLNQLALDQIAYSQFLADESRIVYDTNTLLLFFCYDKERPIRDVVFKYIPKNDSTDITPFTNLHNLDDQQKVLNRVKVDDYENRYVSNALSVLDHYQNMLDYVNNLDFIVFVNYSSALFPRHDFTTGTRGSVSVELDVYQIDNQKLVDSIKVYAESSSTIKTFNGIVTQSALDEDLQHNLEREIIKALTK